jgi:hypothetical protein
MNEKESYVPVLDFKTLAFFTYSLSGNLLALNIFRIIESWNFITPVCLLLCDWSNSILESIPALTIAKCSLTAAMPAPPLSDLEICNTFNPKSQRLFFS